MKRLAVFICPIVILPFIACAATPPAQPALQEQPAEAPTEGKATRPPATDTPEPEPTAILPLTTPRLPSSPTPVPSPALLTTPTELSSTSWKTYHNEEPGFEFQYPKIYDEKEEYQACQVAGGTARGFRVASRIELQIVDSEGLNLVEYVRRFVDERENTDWKLESQQDTTVSGKEAIAIDFRFGGLSRYGTATFVERNDSIYIFSFTAGSFACSQQPGDIPEPAVYTRMVSTFLFIDRLTPPAPNTPRPSP